MQLGGSPLALLEVSWTGPRRRGWEVLLAKRLRKYFRVT
jgi:hypothetical protein